jgi:hypothetical protein
MITTVLTIIALAQYASGVYFKCEEIDDPVDPSCQFGPEVEHRYISGCTVDGCQLYSTLQEAQDACCAFPCGGITHDATGYMTRIGNHLIPSGNLEESWLRL